MVQYRIQIVGDDNQHVFGTTAALPCDDDACSLARLALNPGCRAEVWAGRRLVALVTNRASAPAFRRDPGADAVPSHLYRYGQP